MQLNNQTTELLEKTLAGKGDACILSTVGTNGDSNNVQLAIAGNASDVIATAFGIVEDVARALPDSSKKDFFRALKKHAKKGM